MNVAVDPVAAVKAITRTIKNLERDGKPAKSVIATRVYDTDAADLWNALTSPERIERWFLPVSGDLKVGGRYQFTGNAGGTITECKPNKRIAATWEFGPAVSWVTVTLSPAPGGGTKLELEHTALVDPHWAQFGPGAVGVGWDLGLMGLGIHLRNPTAGRPPEAAETWPGSPVGKAAIAYASSDWGRADIEAGAPRAEALAAAEATRKFYTGEASPPGDVMHAFDVLGDPVRRRILELLADREHASGEVVDVIAGEFGITQGAVSQHLKVLRDSGFATVRPDGARRVYAIDTTPLRGVDAWLDRFRGMWVQGLEALATEIARGKKGRARRQPGPDR